MLIGNPVAEKIVYPFILNKLKNLPMQFLRSEIISQKSRYPGHSVKTAVSESRKAIMFGDNPDRFVAEICCGIRWKAAIKSVAGRIRISVFRQHTERDDEEAEIIRALRSFGIL